MAVFSNTCCATFSVGAVSRTATTNTQRKPSPRVFREMLPRPPPLRRRTRKSKRPTRKAFQLATLQRRLECLASERENELKMLVEHAFGACGSPVQTGAGPLRGEWDSARALLCFMGRLATSEVGYGERGDTAAPDRTLLGPQGPAPNLEGRLPAPGDHAPRALRNAGGRGGLR